MKTFLGQKSVNTILVNNAQYNVYLDAKKLYSTRLHCFGFISVQTGVLKKRRESTVTWVAMERSRYADSILIINFFYIKVNTWKNFCLQWNDSVKDAQQNSLWLLLSNSYNKEVIRFEIYLAKHKK